jgi:hypothetical protein
MCVLNLRRHHAFWVYVCLGSRLDGAIWTLDSRGSGWAACGTLCDEPASWQVQINRFLAFHGSWINEIDLGIKRDFHITERHIVSLEAQAFNLFNHANFFVANGAGANATQFTPTGATCGDGASTNQTCFLVPNTSFGQQTSINQLNGPRVFQFAFHYRF